VSHLPGVHQRVPNAAAPHATYLPYLKHSYTELVGSRSPLLLELAGRFELVGPAPIVPTALASKQTVSKVRLTLTAQFELRITVLVGAN
jgi:hypothetical protein